MGSGKDINISVFIDCGPGCKRKGTLCSMCEAGHFSIEVDANACTQCDVGRASDTRGAASKSACGRCPLGKFANTTGSTQCDKFMIWPPIAVAVMFFLALCGATLWLSWTAYRTDPQVKLLHGKEVWWPQSGQWRKFVGEVASALFGGYTLMAL